MSDLKPSDRSTTVRLFERLGGRVIPVDRIGHRDPFDPGTQYVQACPRCGRFAGILIDRDGTWMATCRCWGRAFDRHDALDLLALLGRAAS